MTQTIHRNKRGIKIIYTVSGHRPERLGLDYSESSTSFLANFCYDSLKDILKNGDELVAGMANGFDTACVMTAIKLNIPFTAVLAFEGQDATWPREARLKWRELLKKAKEVIIASNGGAASWKYLVRDELMVDMGEHLICLWDGVEDGGTFYTRKYATKEGLPITNFWDKWDEMLKNKYEKISRY